MTFKSEDINELASALCKCQSELTFASKDSINPHFKSKFADLASVWDAVRGPLTANGLSVTQLLEWSGENCYLTSILMHKSGQWVKSTIPVLNANKTSQGQGAGITYCRRYSLAALVGCVQDDDDGQSTMPKETIAIPAKGKTSYPVITQDQFKLLSEQADKCDPEYIAKVYSYLETQGVKGFAFITTDLFDRIMTGMKKNVEVYEKANEATNV